MTLRLILSGGAAAMVVALTSCSSPRQDPPPLSPPSHDYQVVQVDKPGRVGGFQVCTDCPRPTRKTLPGAQPLESTRVQVPTEPARVPAATVQVPVPPPKPPRQLTALVHFDMNGAKLTAQAKEQIAAWAGVLRLSSRVQVTGYTDNRGSPNLNTRLSDARALVVVLALREQLDGQSPAPTLSGTGRPLCCYVSDNRSEAGRQTNRRAEVRITVPDSPALVASLQALSGANRLQEIGVPDSATALAGGVRATSPQP